MLRQPRVNGLLIAERRRQYLEPLRPWMSQAPGTVKALRDSKPNDYLKSVAENFSEKTPQEVLHFRHPALSVEGLSEDPRVLLTYLQSRSDELPADYSYSDFFLQYPDLTVDFKLIGQPTEAYLYGRGERQWVDPFNRREDSYLAYFMTDSTSNVPAQQYADHQRNRLQAHNDKLIPYGCLDHLMQNQEREYRFLTDLCNVIMGEEDLDESPETEAAGSSQSQGEPWRRSFFRDLTVFGRWSKEEEIDEVTGTMLGETFESIYATVSYGELTQGYRPPSRPWTELLYMWMYRNRETSSYTMLQLRQDPLVFKERVRDAWEHQATQVSLVSKSGRTDDDIELENKQRWAKALRDTVVGTAERYTLWSPVDSMVAEVSRQEIAPGAKAMWDNNEKRELTELQKNAYCFLYDTICKRLKKTVAELLRYIKAGPIFRPHYRRYDKKNGGSSIQDKLKHTIERPLLNLVAIVRWLENNDTTSTLGYQVLLDDLDKYANEWAKGEGNDRSDLFGPLVEELLELAKVLAAIQRELDNAACQQKWLTIAKRIVSTTLDISAQCFLLGI